MRKIVVLISLFLLPASWAFGQYGAPYGNQGGSYNQGRPYNQGGSYNQGGPYSQRGTSRGGNAIRVEGCVFGEPGNLALIDDQGNTFELRGRTARLNNYIGHRVRVDGRTWFRPDSPFAMSEHGDSTPVLRVFATERVSRGHCDQWGGEPTEFRFQFPGVVIR